MTAADLLSSAADCLLAGDTSDARQLVSEADMPVIGAYTALVTGAVNPLLHWQSTVPTAGAGPERSAQRMPSASAEHAIYARDGWRCRYCGTRVIDRSMRALLHRCLPDVARWGARNADKHTALAALSASLDHILPHSRGGTNDEPNLVTACNACQFGRGQWTLEEVGFFDPREHPPVLDEWDGLTRLSRLAATSNGLQ
ncbi:MAG: HNH endonuclease [Acidovorax sp.]|uniref:HNH endonuclease n=1 Tax=Acidovorax sp. TaxID=1872122 RepID=UPI0025B92BB5|nr:HNH endonuclease [Acidovorax sp.]MCE1194805.1 HNH endonuclease [Acidovorax sp.]